MISRMVYVAGPLRAETPQGVKHNILRAKYHALVFWLCGVAPICPHANTDLCLPGPNGEHVDMGEVVMGSDKVLEGDCTMVRRCDAIYLMPGWSKSSGTRQEKETAQETHAAHDCPVCGAETRKAVAIFTDQWLCIQTLHRSVGGDFSREDYERACERARELTGFEEDE